MIDEATMEFRQSVLSASLSDSQPSDHSHTARWGETENQESTDNEENKENEETDDNTDIEPFEQTATVSIPNPTTAVHDPDTKERQSEDDQSYSPLNEEDERFFADLAAYEETTSDEDNKSDTEEDNREYNTATPLPIIAPIPYSDTSELTGVPMTASMTPNAEQGSSSVEPD